VGQDPASADPVGVAGSVEAPASNVVRVVAAQEGDFAAGSKPASGDGPVLTSPRLQASAKIAAALDTETPLEFSEAPLAEVVDYLKTARDIPIVIDRQALDELGMGTETPVTVSLAGISLRAGLARVLGELGLDYVINNEVLLITSEERARSQLDPRVYSTTGLRIPVEKLMEIITSMVAPDTWEDGGGTGKIASLGDTMEGLVIAQTDQVHDQIADLLEKLRRAQAARDVAGSAGE
jgi:hypothetical protein